MSDDSNIVDLSEARINRMKNLRPYRGKTNEEIREILLAKGNPFPTTKRTPKQKDDYDKTFKEKLDILQVEYAVDMNNSNDVETLKNLVRFQIQLEKISDDIDDMQRKSSLTLDDYKNLKILGDLQRSISVSINDIQEKLGISRKQRKEKQTDDIPVWIEGILKKSKTFIDKKTTVIMCPRCKIELGRFWLNFADRKGSLSSKLLLNEVHFSLQCWKCEEQVEHIQ